MNISVKNLEPFGVMLENHNNETALANVATSVIQELLKKHKLVILRGFAAITKTDLVDYAKKFGPLLEWEFGNVMEMMAHPEPKNYLFTDARVPLHWDGAFYQEPRFLLFNCIEAPDKSADGKTFFSNTEFVFNDLSQAEINLYEHMTFTYETEKIAHYGGKIDVPLIQNHPDSSAKIIRFAEPVAHQLNPVTVKILNQDADTTDSIIQKLSEKFYDKKYYCEHEWHDHDLLISDNFSLLHGRNAFNQYAKRHLRRIQIK